jgi:hypothetical protein
MIKRTPEFPRRTLLGFSVNRGNGGRPLSSHERLCCPPLALSHLQQVLYKAFPGYAE